MGVREHKKDGWSVWMLLTVQVPFPSLPLPPLSFLTHTSTAESWLWAEPLYCSETDASTRHL